MDGELVAKKHKDQNEKYQKKNSEEFDRNMKDDADKKSSARIEIKTNEAFKKLCELYSD